jgi:DNA-binding NtrC family response regulator
MTKDNQNPTILVVDDERGVRESFNMVLKDTYSVLLADTGKQAMALLMENQVDLILLDILLPDINGIELLEKLKKIDHTSDIIMVTAVKDLETAVKAIKLGAYEYIVKPFVVDDVLALINRALEKRNLLKEVVYLRDELKRHHLFEKMVGQDRKMQGIFELISTISGTDGTVLIQGESGTGKELVARAIHNRGARKENPFVVINCAAIPGNLMESEIFGHIRGAFTGATTTSLGKLEIANKGTVFLDDIDSLDLNMQAKLLRVIQEKEFERLGSNKVIRLDVRFLAASNKNLEGLIAEDRFREDLYYRLNVLPVRLPPLRERQGDIPLLLNYFAERYATQAGSKPKKFSKKALQELMEYEWPGNVRELKNLVERLSTITKKPVIQLQDLTLSNVGLSKVKGMKLKDAVKAFEKQYIQEVLEITNGNKKKAAELLAIHRNTLSSKLHS